MENQFTKTELLASEEYKKWIDGRVSLIHNTYYDSKDVGPSYIVIHSTMGKWTITRFWLSPNRKDRKIQVSVDYRNQSTDEVFEILLSEYSRGLA